MKKIVTTAGLAALGVVSMQAAPDVGLTPSQTSKPWSLSANLRGFYDDNITTAPNAIAEDSVGIEFSPAISLNLVKDQTYLGLGYEYKLRWFEDRDPDNSDHSHRFSLDLTHDFNENMSVDLGDEFVIAQEPEVLEPTGASRLRSNMDAIHNRAHVNFTTQLSRTYSLMAGYRNDLYNYDQSGAGSFSALLDRVEHRVTANLRSQLRPGTTGILGYQYRVVNYTSDDSLMFGPKFRSAEERNSDSQYVYAGFDHSFTPELLASLRAGAQFTSYDNVAAGVDDSTTSPYIDANLSYAYAKGSNIALGLRHERNQTDIAQVGGSLILDQETTSAYASVSHQLTAKLTANFVGMYANSSFGDSLADTSDNFWSLGFNMSYQINQYLLAETGYNFDDLDSDLGNRSFDRNRVYLGLKASY
jgi:hypothetical protein